MQQEIYFQNGGKALGGFAPLSVETFTQASAFKCMATNTLDDSYFEELIKQTASGDDPLSAYISYHSWLKKSKKNAKQQTSIIFRAVRTFRRDQRYHRDKRYIQICALYAQALPNPLEYFEYLTQKKIGTTWALFYEAKALFQERESLYREAAKTFEDGIRKGAQPLDRLKQNYETFKQRRKAKEQSETFSTSSDLQYEELRAKNYWKNHKLKIAARKSAAAEAKEKQKIKEAAEHKKREELKLIQQEKQKEEERRAREEIEKKQKIKEEQAARKLREAAEFQKQKELEEKQKQQREAAELQKKLEREAAELKQREEAGRKKQEELERLQKIKKEAEEREAERKAREEMDRKRNELELRKREEEEQKQREEAERKKQQEIERLAEMEREAAQFEFGGSDSHIIDLSALDMENSGEIDLTSEPEDLAELSFEESLDHDENEEKTVVLAEDTFAFEGDDLDILTRSGSSMFNILDRTSNINGTIHKNSDFLDKTVTLFTKQAEDLMKDSFAGPLSDEESEESEEEEEDEEDEDTHIHGFTGHITTPELDDPLASFEICQDNSEPFKIGVFTEPETNSAGSASFAVFGDENNPPASTNVLQELPLASVKQEPFEILTEEVAKLEIDAKEEEDFVVYSQPEGSHDSVTRSSIIQSDDDNKENEEVGGSSAGFVIFQDENFPDENASFAVFTSPQRTDELLLAPLKICKSSPASPFVVLRESENDGIDIFDLADSEDSSAFSVYKSPQSVPKSPFCVFQESSEANLSQSKEIDIFQLDLSNEARSEDIFDLSDLDDDDIYQDDSSTAFFEDEEPALFSEEELHQKLNIAGTVNPYTHQHAQELQSLPKFQLFMQRNKSQEVYIKWEEKAPKSHMLQQQPKRMRSSKFKEEEFEEFPLFIGDTRSVTNNSVLSLGPCIGSGGFAKVFLAHHFLELDPDNDTMFIEESRRALKFQKHSQDPWAIRWEFYLMSVLHSRLPSVLENSMYDLNYMSQRFCSAMYLREFEDASFLMLSYLDQGTLFDIINAHRTKKRKIEESLIAFFALEILSILYNLHRCNIIHGDIKPDNFLFMNENAPGKSWNEWKITGDDSWKFRGLQLIDFGRGLDLSLYEACGNQLFEGDNHVKELQCLEMRNGSPWSFHIDLFGACAIIHLLLHLIPIEIVEKKPSRKSANITGVEDKKYFFPKENFKRYWSFNWELLFLDLLQIKEGASCTDVVKKHILLLQSFVSENSKKIRVALSKEHQLMQDQGF